MNKSIKTTTVKKTRVSKKAPIVPKTPVEQFKESYALAFPRTFKVVGDKLNVVKRPGAKYFVLMFTDPRTHQTFVISENTLLVAEQILSPANDPIHSRNISGVTCAPFVVTVAHLRK
jgi:hypothetical protein